MKIERLTYDYRCDTCGIESTPPYGCQYPLNWITLWPQSPKEKHICPTCRLLITEVTQDDIKNGALRK